MLPLPQHEEVLRADLATARHSLDAAREAVASSEVAEEAGKLMREAALS